MGAIYGLATCVLAWVGEHSERSDALFSPMPAVDRANSGVRELIVLPAFHMEERRRKDIWLSFPSRKYWTRTWYVLNCRRLLGAEYAVAVVTASL